MLKKLMILVTVVSVLLVSSLSCTNVFADLGTYDYIHGGTIVIEGSYTATSDSKAQIGFVSGTSTSKTGYRDRWTRFMDITGTTVSNVNKATTVCTLTENEDYFFTIIYRHSTAETASGAGYEVYINGVKVGNTTDYNHHKDHYIDALYCTGINTLAFVSDDVAASYDMAPYSATLTSDSQGIVLGGTDVKNDNVFGGFKASLFAEMTAAEFKQNVIAPEGATVTVTRSGSALDDAQQLQSGDIVSVTSANGKVTNEYLVSLTKFALSSETYNISTDLVISDVYEYTPVSTFMNYLSVGEGWNVTLKNGEDEVTNGMISEEMTIEAVNADGEAQVYTVDIPDRQSKTTTSSSDTVVFTNAIHNQNDFRGNFVIELNTTVAGKYYTGPNGNNAFYITANDTEVKLGMFKSLWSGDILTDLEVGEPLSIIFVVRPVTTATSNNNMVDYYINGDHVGTCSMDSIKAASWINWRVHANTEASFFMAEDVRSYLASKNANKIYKNEDGTVGVELAAADAHKLYMAVYNGDKMESVQIADIADYNFKNNKLSIPEDVDGKTVKAFLWGAKLNPLDIKIIQE